MAAVDLRDRHEHGRPEQCFEEFYAHECRRLARALTLMCGDAELAADCVADAFERACARWDRVRTLEDPAGWVRRVAVNRLHDARRTLVRRDALLVRIGVGADVGAADATADDSVLAAVAGLSDQQRAVVALHYLDDQPVDEVAEALGLSAGTVKYHLHQARGRLRGALGRASADPPLDRVELPIEVTALAADDPAAAF